MANLNKFPSILRHFFTILFMDIIYFWCQTAKINVYKGKMP